MTEADGIIGERSVSSNGREKAMDDNNYNESKIHTKLSCIVMNFDCFNPRHKQRGAIKINQKIQN